MDHNKIGLLWFSYQKHTILTHEKGENATDTTPIPRAERLYFLELWPCVLHCPRGMQNVSPPPSTTTTTTTTTTTSCVVTPLGKFCFYENIISLHAR
jgi:hypothetical protein